jgi:glycogen synthase
MRVLMFSWEFPPFIVGGMGNHAAGLAPALGGLSGDAALDHVDVITTRYGGGRLIEKLNDRVTVHRLDLPALDPVNLYNSVVSNNHYFIEYARAIAHEAPYDLIHIHDWLMGAAGVHLKYEWKVPLVTTIHATERGRHQGYLPSGSSLQIDAMERQVSHEAWKIIVCSRFMTSELNTYFGSPYDKLVVIPNGINSSSLYHCTTQEKLALQQQLAPNGEKLLFFVGRIVYEKGLHVLVQAMPMILRDHPEARLLIAGKNSRQMWAMACHLEVQNAIHLLDYVTDKQRDAFYQIVDAAIFPSLYEPFGIVALEAMALGCNVIASDVGGLSEVVLHMQNGLTVFPDDPGSIAWAVRTLFADPSAAQRRRAIALQHVEQLYNWHEIARQTSSLYHDIFTARGQTDW